MARAPPVEFEAKIEDGYLRLYADNCVATEIRLNPSSTSLSDAINDLEMAVDLANKEPWRRAIIYNSEGQEILSMEALCSKTNYEKMQASIKQSMNCLPLRELSRIRTGLAHVMACKECRTSSGIEYMVNPEYGRDLRKRLREVMGASPDENEPRT